MEPKDTKTTPAPVRKKRPSRFLTPAQKAEAIALWRAGSTTLEELSKKFKKDQSTLVRLFKTEGVKKGEASAEAAAKVTAAVEAAIVDDATVLANRIRETKEDHYKIAAAISRLSYTLLAKAKQENRPIASLQNDMKTLKLAAEVQKLTLEQRYTVLGISADDEADDRPMPDLVIQELTAEDIKAMHAQNLVADDDGIDMELGDEALIDTDEEDEDERVEVDD